MPNAMKQVQNDAPHRRRGRPTGKNRVPLSLKERQARNALYERERREKTALAMTQLAETINCDPNISNVDLLATTISQIQRHIAKASEDNIEDLLRVNSELETQIAMLQERLGLDDASLHQTDDNEFINTRKRRLSDKRVFQEKRAKTRSETSADSGIEVQSIISPLPECDGSPMDILMRSLFEIPAIKSPKVHSELPAPSYTVSVRTSFTTGDGPNSDPVVRNSVDDIDLAGTEMSLDLLTDNETHIIGEWLEEYQADNDINDQTPIATMCRYDNLSRYW